MIKLLRYLLGLLGYGLYKHSYLAQGEWKRDFYGTKLYRNKHFVSKYKIEKIKGGYDEYL